MRFVRVCSVITGVVLTALTSVAPAVAAPSAAHYVALGDSYAAGVGAGNYDPASKSCMRSSNAYPALWESKHIGSYYTSVACLGATTADVLNNQLAAVKSDTTLITVTIGGNDIGFADVLKECVFPGNDQGCLARVDTAESAMRQTLPDNLDRTYQAIRQHAPTAKVVVVGYPKLFELGSCLGGLSLAKRTKLDEGANILAGVIAARAQAAGFGFADARSAFAGHGVCSKTSWIHGVTYPIETSYHPTATGQAQGYLPIVTQALG